MSAKELVHLIPSDQIVKSKVDLGVRVKEIVRDSRRVTPGCVYFAIPGSQVDGHDFIDAAFKQGAGVVVMEKTSLFDENDRVILVNSVRETYAHACSNWFGKQNFFLVGVTGTNGKTTTSYLLHQMWSALSRKAGMIGTIEVKIGKKSVPTTLTTPDALDLHHLFSKMNDAKCEQVIMEVSSIALDQYRVSGTQFDVGLFTNLSQDHLDYHKTIDSYFESKKKLFVDYGIKSAVINIDDYYGEKLYRELEGVEKVSFSTETPGADFFVDSVSMSKGGTEAILFTPNGEYPIFTPLLGEHNLKNILGALAVVYLQGLDLDMLIPNLVNCPGAPGRLELVQTKASQPTVFVDYAHTPDALVNVLKLIQDYREIYPGKIITVFGCGGDRDKTKRPQMAKAAMQGSDVVFVTSDNPRTEDPEIIIDDIFLGIEKNSKKAFRVTDRRQAIEQALSLSGPNDLVLIAGKGHENYQIVGETKFPFDDRLVIEEYYKKGRNN